jgi:hypothetical protein
VIRTLLAALAALGLPPSYVPTPIGVGPRFHPPPARHAPCVRGAARYGVHLELFARGRVVMVPAGICSSALRTRYPTGVIEVTRPATLGGFFRVWRQPLSRTRLVGFRTTTRNPVRAYVGGRRWRGGLGAIPLRRHAQIVLELGAYIPPHPTFLFGPSL